jgi:uncharacterized protein
MVTFIATVSPPIGCLMPNRLADATSPYLLQHRDNPVDWREWGEVAFAEAKARDVPVLLSVGYAACHWCHVMAHESFEDADLAARMNRDFVNVKVDREERPDVDQVYQHALAALGQHGGWPLTMFLTPDGEPFWGGTYFPREERHGMAAFARVLDTIARLWADERAQILSNRDALEGALDRLVAVAEPRDLPDDLADRAALGLMRAFDADNGGVGDAPKFPQPTLLELWWRRGLTRDLAEPRDAALFTLERMARGGIHDHVGGGFARYATDAEWRVPHFEKMLYDNALLLELYAEAAARTGRAVFRRAAAGIVAWLEREMIVAGAFAASLDADSEGVEGRFYVWSRAELDRLFGAEADAVAATFDVRTEGNWEGTNVLNRLGDAALDDPDHEARVADWCARLLTARAARVRPQRDDKVLTDWNGMAIAALARAGQWLERPDWVRLAADAFDAVVAKLADGDGLVHTWRDGRRLELGFLDDHVHMARAALALHLATGATAYRGRAEDWLAAATRRFRDDEGCWRPGPDEGLLPVRSRWAQDGPIPSPLGALAALSAQLYHVGGETAHGRRAQDVVDRYAGELAAAPAAYGSLMTALGWLRETTFMVFAGPDTAPLKTAAARALPGYALAVETADTLDLPADHPASGKGPLAGASALWVCRAGACRPPVTAPAEVAGALEG